MRKAEVHYKGQLAGILSETDEGRFVFQYTDIYAENTASKPITLTMPVSKLPYGSNVLFPFFEGLIPEGWLLNVASTSWKINKSDRMGLLIACCANCIGAVSIHPYQEYKTS